MDKTVKDWEFLLFATSIVALSFILVEVPEINALNGNGSKCGYSSPIGVSEWGEQGDHPGNSYYYVKLTVTWGQNGVVSMVGSRRSSGVWPRWSGDLTTSMNGFQAVASQFAYNGISSTFELRPELFYANQSNCVIFIDKHLILCGQYCSTSL